MKMFFVRFIMPFFNAKKRKQKLVSEDTASQTGEATSSCNLSCRVWMSRVGTGCIGLANERIFVWITGARYKGRDYLMNEWRNSGDSFDGTEVANESTVRNASHKLLISLFPVVYTAEPFSARTPFPNEPHGPCFHPPAQVLQLGLLVTFTILILRQ